MWVVCTCIEADKEQRSLPSQESKIPSVSKTKLQAPLKCSAMRRYLHRVGGGDRSRMLSRRASSFIVDAAKLLFCLAAFIAVENLLMPLRGTGKGVGLRNAGRTRSCGARVASAAPFGVSFFAISEMSN